MKEQVKGKEVKTGLTGTCAAPKLIWSIIDRTGGMSATTMLHASMTERWVSPLNDKSTVPIVDAHGDVVEYGSGQIVPSCKACQHLMHGLEDRLHRQLQDNLKFKLYREEELSPENIERKSKSRKNERSVGNNMVTKS